MNALFAYGSLMDGDVFNLITGVCREPIPAILHDFSRFGVHGESYPCAIENAGGSIEGFLFHNLSPEILARLDQFEGDEYDRISVSVITASGEQSAQMYRYAQQYYDKIKYEPWDFDEFLSARKLRFLELCYDSKGIDSRFQK